MRKNRLLLCIALMLVFAMSLAMFVACADDQTEKPIDPDTPVTPDDGDGPTGDTGMNNGGGSSSSTVDGVTVVQSGLSAQKAFEINGGITDFSVSIETPAGKNQIIDYIPVPDSSNDDIVHLYAPKSGWPKNGTIVIELYNDAYLVEYPDAKTFMFTVAQESGGVQIINSI